MNIGFGIVIIIMLGWLCLMMKILTELAVNLAISTPREKEIYLARLRQVALQGRAIHAW